MKKAKESFQKAAKSIEDAPNYNQAGVIYTGMKVNLRCTPTPTVRVKLKRLSTTTFSNNRCFL